jgi:hypothetical protein
MLVQIRLMATNIIALYKPDWELIGELTGLDRDGRKSTLAKLTKPKQSGNPWLLHEDGYAWVVNGFRHEFGFREDGHPRQPSPQQMIAAVRALSMIPTHIRLRSIFAKYYSSKGLPELSTLLTPFIDDTVSTRVSIQQGRESGSGTGSGSGSGTGSSAPAAPGAEANVVLDWFYGLWKGVNGRDYPKSAEPYMKAKKAAERLLKDKPAAQSVDAFLASLRPVALSALRGEYLAATPGTLAAFVAGRGKYTDANRKGGAYVPPPPPREDGKPQKSTVQLMRERGEIP